MKKVIAYWIIVALATTLGIYASKWIGENLVKAPADLRSLVNTDCSAPCWEGLQLGISNYPNTLPDHPDFSVDVQPSRSDKVGLIKLFPRHSILLGDLIAIWGYPSHVQMGYIPTRTNTIGVVVILYFQEGLVKVRLISTLDSLPLGRLSPYMRVLNIEYNAPSPEGSIVPIGTPLWRGFGATYPLER
jgi:hypothetical protein